MQFRVILIGAVFFLGTMGGCLDSIGGTKNQRDESESAPAAGSSSAEASNPGGPFTLRSTAFAPQQPIPTEHSCDGANVSPPLSFLNASAGTQSLALIMLDPDAPGGRTVIHWTFWNLPPKATELPKKADVTKLGAREGDTGGGRTGYRGPCPPYGTHRYFFTGYALGAVLDLPQGASLEALQEAIRPHILASSEMYGTYWRVVPLPPPIA